MAASVFWLNKNTSTYSIIRILLFIDNDCCNRQCCGPARSFDIKILDNNNQEVIHLNRPLRCSECCFPCCLQELEVTSPPGTPVGYVIQKLACFKVYSCGKAGLHLKIFLPISYGNWSLNFENKLVRKLETLVSFWGGFKGG